MLISVPRFLRQTPWWQVLTCLLAVGGLGSVQAQEAPSAAALQKVAQVWLQDALVGVQPAGATTLRMEATVGEIDSRLRLAPCAKVEAYLPAGASLWGKTRVGLRCADGMGRWNISVPVMVNAFGPAWVVKSQVAAGSALSADDVTLVEVNWAEQAAPVLHARAQWEGQIATRVLTTGQAVRQGMVKPAQVFSAGASVRVVAQGPGFQVSSDATALSAGIVGQMAQVRMDNGRVASGVVLDMRTVKIDL